MPDSQDIHTDPFIGRLLCDGEYHIQRVLGHGSMGKIFLATHTILRMPFVLKQGRADQPLPEQAVAELDRVLHSGNINFNSNVQQSQEQAFPGSGGEHTDRFLREALLLARLEHPSIPTLYDYFAEDGYWYMVVDYVPGPALHTYLKSRKYPHKNVSDPPPVVGPRAQRPPQELIRKHTLVGLHSQRPPQELIQKHTLVGPHSQRPPQGGSLHSKDDQTSAGFSDRFNGDLYTGEARDAEIPLMGVMPLAPLEALNYAMQLCDALDYLHQHTPPIILCDLKPSNIILTPDGALMLVDFGSARYFKTGQLNDTINDTTDCGTPGYASPEQYASKSQADMRSDLYSLGVILHEMLSGRHPQGTDAQLEPLYTLRSDISTALSGLVKLATYQDPLNRFQSAHALYQALERVYSIEESRVYQHRIAEQNDDINESQAQSAEQAMLSSPEHATPLYQQSETIPVISGWTMNLDLRRKIRERVQGARQEQQAKAIMLEQQFVSIDESLKWRAQLPLAPTSPSPSSLEDQLPQRNREFPCAPWIGFLLVIAILLALASLLLYMRYIIPITPLQ